MNKSGWLLIGVLVCTCLLSCSGDEASTDGVTTNSAIADVECVGQCTNSSSFLSTSDVKQLLAQGIAHAKSINKDATFAIVDRVGNVLAVYRMAGVNTQITISSTGVGSVPVDSGLEGIVLPDGLNGDGLAAISKAITAAYVSSEGNAFSTRTAAQIVQEHFNPGELNQPAGPLFGVQFSQLACSDFSARFSSAINTAGPYRSPLGLSADDGGFPVYRDGALLGAVGVVSDKLYDVAQSSISSGNVIPNDDETIALATSFGFYAPLARRANRITVDGKVLSYSAVEPSEGDFSAATAADFDALTSGDGQLIAITGYANATLRQGAVFGQASSGIRADTGAFAANNGYVFVDNSNGVRFLPAAGGDALSLPASVMSLTAAEVTTLLNEALSIANKSRAQIRQPLGSQARVTISVVDSQGNNLGMVQTKDAPVFGADVSLQKARTAAMFSSMSASAYLQSMTQLTNYLNADLTVKKTIDIADYVSAATRFIGAGALSDGVAFSDRAGGNLSRPFFPDGIDANVHGPFSKSIRDNQWSVFSTGLQLDLVMNQMVAHLLYALDVSSTDVTRNCIANPSARTANGIQIFPGSVPIYRDNVLVGAIGVSGDGVDQDDMIAFLAVHQSGESLGTLNNAPVAQRADNLIIQQQRLRYVQCPQTPFIDSNEQSVCDGK